MAAMSTLRPLSEGNRLQRWYDAWAQPYYARMPAETRASAEMLDRFLYSRRGLGVWIGLACAFGGSAAGLRAAGMPWWLAVLLSGMFWLVVPLGGLSAWLSPRAILKPQPLRKMLAVLALGLLAALAGFTFGHVARRGSFDFTVWSGTLLRNLPVVLAVALAVMLGLALLVWGIAHIRSGMLQQELERASLAREAAEARLRLLQAQIQPHFIFNTLSALQHWVETADPRAPALLRSLTAFLRGSTEQLTRDQTTLAEELAMVGHYLAIQQARLGERLRSQVLVEPGLGQLPLPPGLLLTLVENAVEHGIAPALGGGEIEVQARHDAGGCLIRVANTGAGLAPDWREGVGLANSRQRLLHRQAGAGTLELHTTEQGTEAQVRLPAPAAATHATATGGAHGH
jgi:Histidine kinase